MLKVISSLFIICISLNTVYGTGELLILHHPSSLQFKGHEHLKETLLKEVYSASLGFTTQQQSYWDGLYIEDPFNMPEAIVTVAVDGVESIDNQKGHHYPLRTNEEDISVYENMEKRISERYPESKSNMVEINLSNGLEDIEKYAFLKGIKHDKPKKSVHNHLKLSVDEDREFLKEVALLNLIAEKVEQGSIQRDYVPDIYWFKVTGLHAIVDLYGANSTQAKEAKILLNHAILKLNTAFSKAYKGSVLVNVITSDASHTRRARNILAAKETNDKTKYNLASNYGKDYPVIFNMILWFGVIMTFSILAICMAIMNMDPGRDSIIYRMTSTTGYLLII